MSPQHILVGVDGSATSKLALRWALRHAELIRGRITALMAWEYPTVYTWEVPSTDHLELATAQALAEVIDEVAGDTSIEVVHQVTPGNPVRALLDAGAQADLIVVGSRGHGGFLNALLGSVSHSVATHSACPSVVVHASGTPNGPVVVGVDASQSNRAALDFAFQTASQRETSLLAVQALPDAYFVPGPLPHPDREELRQEADRQLTEHLSGWSETYPDVPVHRLPRNDHPVTALREAAQDAQLIVVGHRGSGGFRGMLLGSVATGILHHATCPVAIVAQQRRE